MTLGGMLDSGSMACAVSDTAMCNLLSAGAVCEADRFSTDVTLIGVGGQRVHPKSWDNLCGAWTEDHLWEF